MIALLQTKQVSDSKLPFTLTSSVTAGSLLFCALSKSHDYVGPDLGHLVPREGTPNPTDNQGNTYTLISSNDKFVFYQAFTQSSGSLTITLNYIYDVEKLPGWIISTDFEPNYQIVREYSGLNNRDILKIGPSVVDVPEYTLTSDSPTASPEELIITYFYGPYQPEIPDATYTNNIYINLRRTDVDNLYIQDRIISSIETPTYTLGYNYYDEEEMIYYPYGTGFGTMVSFMPAPPPSCVKIRGKCKLRGNIKIK